MQTSTQVVPFVDIRLPQIRLIPQFSTEIFDEDQLKKIIPQTGRAFMKLRKAVYNKAKPDRILVIRILEEGDPEFEGHFLGNPIFPGYCYIELSNLACVALFKQRFPDLAGYPVTGGQDKTRIKGQSFPGDTLNIYAYLTGVRMGKYFFNAEIFNQNGKKIFFIENIIGTAIGQ